MRSISVGALLTSCALIAGVYVLSGREQVRKNMFSTRSQAVVQAMNNRRSLAEEDKCCRACELLHGVRNFCESSLQMLPDFQDWATPNSSCATLFDGANLT
jgi:hypothetical protein